MEVVKEIQEYIKEHESLNLRYEGELLEFDTPGYDVYNCSTPFEYEGENYIFGRVERRDLWATSKTFLFRLDENKIYRPTGLEYVLEDPFLTVIDGEFVLLGVYVVKNEKNEVITYYIKFYRGKSPFELKEFATGPDYMKDIRILKLMNGRIGIFSRPRCDEVLEAYGTISQVGYTEVASLDDINPEVIENAKLIPNLFAKMEWGGVNEAYQLTEDLIGVIGHHSYSKYINDVDHPVYTNVSYIYDIKENRVRDKKVIGIKNDYKEVEPKLSTLDYVAFTSGIKDIGGGRVKLYSGLGDAREGYIIIDDPFIEYR